MTWQQAHHLAGYEQQVAELKPYACVNSAKNE